MKKAVLLLFCFAHLVSAAFANTYTVTTGADSIIGSLRWAIESANGNPGPDLITFNIPDTDPDYQKPMGGPDEWWRIPIIGSALYITDEGTVIDGTTQTLSRGNRNSKGPELELTKASGGPVFTYGLVVFSGECVVKSMVINKFTGCNIYLASSNNEVKGCYVGLDPLGSTIVGTSEGVEITGAYNIVGGSAAADRNVISGNRYDGIWLHGASNEVIGNYVGTDATGSFAVKNGDSGIRLSSGAKYNIIGAAAAGNVISGNGKSGIRFDGATEGTQESNYNQIKGNYIGTDKTGAFALGNGQGGVVVRENNLYNVIGGSLPPGGGNIISGNISSGIRIMGIRAASNEVKGNLIGTDATGTYAIGNTIGVVIDTSAEANIVGSLVPGERNIISGNLTGGAGAGLSATRNRYVGNYVGTDISGTSAIPNYIGLASNLGGFNNAFGPNNIVAFNTYGILISGETDIRNTITQNSLFSNFGEAIYLLDGGNEMMIYPTITGATGTTLSGTAPASSVVEVFLADTTAVPSGRGQGKTYLGSGSANALGDWSVTLGSLASGSTVCATATDVAGNTSEFSYNYTVTTPTTTSTTVTVTTTSTTTTTISGNQLFDDFNMIMTPPVRFGEPAIMVLSANFAEPASVKVVIYKHAAPPSEVAAPVYNVSAAGFHTFNVPLAHGTGQKMMKGAYGCDFIANSSSKAQKRSFNFATQY